MLGMREELLESEMELAVTSHTEPVLACLPRGASVPSTPRLYHLERGDPQSKLSAVLFLNEGWREADGGETTLYDFDDASGSFSARMLPVGSGTLLLFRSDRALLRTAPTAQPRFTLGMHFHGHYT